MLEAMLEAMLETCVPDADMGEQQHPLAVDNAEDGGLAQLVYEHSMTGDCLRKGVLLLLLHSCLTTRLAHCLQMRRPRSFAASPMLKSWLTRRASWA